MKTNFITCAYMPWVTFYVYTKLVDFTRFFISTIFIRALLNRPREFPRTTVKDAFISSYFARILCIINQKDYVHCPVLRHANLLKNFKSLRCDTAAASREDIRIRNILLDGWKPGCWLFFFLVSFIYLIFLLSFIARYILHAT